MTYEAADANLFYRNPVSALDTFASIALKNKPRRYGLLRRKRYNLNQANANLMMYTPFMKMDTVIQGDQARWHADALAEYDTFVESIEEIAKREKGEITETERRISQIGSAIGLAAAPGAAYSAVKAAKNSEGGFPRSVVRGSVKRLPKGSPARRRTEKALKALDKPMTPKAKAAAIASGAVLVGLQGANILGDAVTSRTMANAERR